MPPATMAPGGVESRQAAIRRAVDRLEQTADGQVFLGRPMRLVAPDIAGKGIANPCSLILSTLMLLRHVGMMGTAARMENALLASLEQGVRTGDFGDAAFGPFAANTPLELPAVEKISESSQEDPFQVLIGTLLSARTKDATTAAASARLFAAATTPRASRGRISQKNTVTSEFMNAWCELSANTMSPPGSIKLTLPVAVTTLLWRL